MYRIRPHLLLLFAHASALIPLSAYQKWRQDFGFQVRSFHSSCLSQSLPQADEVASWQTAQNEDDEFEYMRKLTQDALENCGDHRGLETLEILSELCSARRPFHFSSGRIHPDGSVVAKIPGLMPQSVTEMVFDKTRRMVEKGWLSTNPDSVDGLPSFHLNLISDGIPIVDVSPDAELDDFKSALREITELVTPLVYERLLPQVRAVMNSSEICVGDVFLRRYGTDVLDGKSRNGISAHYDVYSQVTSVIALDDVAKDGSNGLYTMLVSPAEGSPCGKTSNHASLRRFFPLACGDAVVHTWDVLHGVDVEPGLDRTSLIVWFTTSEELSASNDSVSPWLSNRADLSTSHVAQFVLASALESSEQSHTNDKDATTRSKTLYSRKSHQLYLQSAARGNSFALTRIGSLCENNELDRVMKNEAATLLASLQKKGELPSVLVRSKSFNTNTPIGLAKGFWWEGSIRGNPRAQMALADEIMMEASQSNYSGQARLFAAMLFALAAQQGNPDAFDSLRRVMQLELAARNDEIESEEDFLNLPIVQVANSAMSAL